MYVKRGGELEWSAHCNAADVRWLLAERPLVVAGVDPRQFARAVPALVLQRQMRPQIENYLDDLRTWASFDVSWTQRYAVEARSRMLYTLERGRVISKHDALRWAAERLSRKWRDLIEQVRRARFVHWNDPPRLGSVDRSIAFVRDVRESARIAAAEGAG